MFDAHLNQNKNTQQQYSSNSRRPVISPCTLWFRTAWIRSENHTRKQLKPLLSLVCLYRTLWYLFTIVTFKSLHKLFVKHGVTNREKITIPYLVFITQMEISKRIDSLVFYGLNVNNRVRKVIFLPYMTVR